MSPFRSAIRPPLLFLLTACGGSPWDTLETDDPRAQGPDAVDLDCFVMEPKVLDFGVVDRRLREELRSRILRIRNVCNTAQPPPEILMAPTEPGARVRAFQHDHIPGGRLSAGHAVEVTVIAAPSRSGVYQHTVFSWDRGPRTRPGAEREVGRVRADVQVGSVELYGPIPTIHPIQPGCGTRLRFTLQHWDTLPVHIDEVRLNEDSAWTLTLPEGSPPLPWTVTADNARDHVLELSLPAAEDPEPRSLHLLLAVPEWEGGGDWYGRTNEQTRYALMNWNNRDGTPGWVRAPLVQHPEPGTLQAHHDGKPVRFAYYEDANEMLIFVEPTKEQGDYVQIRYTPRCEP